MKIFRRVLICILSVMMIGGTVSAVGCSTTEESLTDPQFVHVYPQKVTGHLSNPGMGWVGIEETINYGQVEVGGAGNLPEVDVVSIESTWNYLEPEKDHFDFDLMDRTIEYWTGLGKRINFRIMTDMLVLGFTWNGAPEWLINDPRVGYEVIEFDQPSEYRPVNSYKAANLRSAYYQERLSIFLDKLVEHYGDNEAVDVVEIRGYGNWGEWHSGINFNTMNERITTLTQIVDKYAQAWGETGKVMVVSASWDPNIVNYYGDSYEAYYRASIYDYIVKQENMTFRRDGAGGPLFMEQWEGRLLSDFVRSGKRLPLYAEFSLTAAEMAAANENDYNFENAVNHMLFKNRPNSCSVIGWNNYQAAWMIRDGQTLPFDMGNEMLGYRISVDEARFQKQIQPGDSLDVMTKMSNSGVGRFYFNDKLKFYIVDEFGETVATAVNPTADIRTLMLGDSVEYHTQVPIPENLADGTYSVQIAVVNEAEQPHIKLAIEGDHDKKIYKLGSFEVRKGSGTKAQIPEAKLSGEELEKYVFDQNSLYTVSFDYLPKFDLQNFDFGNYDGYAIRLKSSDGAVNQIIEKFQDVSGEKGTKTVQFATGNHSDYHLSIVSENFGEIEIDNAYVRKEAAGNIVSFNGGKLGKNSQFSGTSIASISNENAIRGDSLIIAGESTGHVSAATYNEALKPNTTYTVAFNTKTIKDVGIGGYMFCSLDSGESKDVFKWYERPDTPMTYQQFTFTTGSTGGKLSFGIHNRGTYAVDDFVIIEGYSGEIGKVQDLGFKHNVMPAFEDRMGQVEGFEDISLMKTMLDWGWNRWGQLTRDPEKVISGESSFLGKVNKNDSAGEFMEFAYSSQNFIRFEPNTTYRIEFDYRIVQDPKNEAGDGGYFYFLVRSGEMFEQSGAAADIGFTMFASDSSKPVGSVQHMTAEFTTGNASDFKVTFGQRYYGEIVIDNVKFSKV